MKSVSMTPTRIVAALVAAGMLGGAGASIAYHEGAHAAVPPAASATVTPPLAQPVVGGPDFSAIVQRYGPSVVNISVSGMKKVAADEGPQGNPGIDPNDPFFQFFRQFMGPNGQFHGFREMPVRGEGSGFIVSSDGLILTNAHVVRDAKQVIVKLTDRREFKARVLGSDPQSDVAVLKIDAKNLTPVPLGNPNDLKVGQWVLAIGSPFGFENSVTAGIVSAKGRSLPDDSYVPFIQTDVPVNPGNSGGPLFNTLGQVVGINSQIYTRTGGYEGLSFAIPINVALKVKDQIVETGKVQHARLGVAIQQVDQTLADSFKLPRPEGALVASVQKGGPADKAGLKTGDVILAVNGQKIATSGDLPAMIAQSKPGEKVAIEVWRGGKDEHLVANLGNANDASTKVASASDSSGQGRLGLALRPLQPQERQQAGVNHGLLIEDVNGPAELAGVQPGDVLLAVNGTSVQTVQQVRDVVSKSAKSVALLIERGGNRIFVPVRIG